MFGRLSPKIWACLKVTELDLLIILQSLPKKNITVLEEAPYSLDLSPWDFFLFLKLKGIIEGTHFKGVEATKRAETTEQKGIPEEFFQLCLEAWQRRIVKYIRSSGDFFERETM